MSDKEKSILTVVDVARFTFDSSGQYELTEIVDPMFLSQIGGGVEVDLNVSKQCGDENSGAQCGTDVNLVQCITNDQCQTNKTCTNTCGEDGDDE